MGKEFAHISKFVCLQTMYGFILLQKYLLERSHIFLIQHTEALNRKKNTGYIYDLIWVLAIGEKQANICYRREIVNSEGNK